MQLVAVGINHESGSVSLRERLTVSPESLPRVLCQLRESVAEALVLSTCNRVELYAVCGHESSGTDILRQFLATHGNVPLRTVREATYAHGHESAARHMMRVAAGLDSMVVGENEILGQVRRALMAAREVGAVGPVLDRLGDSALVCGKRTRASTALGRDGDSVAAVAVRLAQRERCGLESAHVVVLGAGEAARSALAQLSTHGVAQITILSRTHDRAADLAASVGARVRPWDQLHSALGTADVVLSCTGSRTPVVDAAVLTAARVANAKALVCVDLGLPRDIDTAVASLPGVRLIGLDHIEAEVVAHRADRARDVACAESIVGQETERYMEWWRGRGVASTISRLHERADAIREAEVERALARLPELSSHARAVIRDLSSRVVGKLLREPTLALKRDPEGANMAVVLERLFALSDARDVGDVGNLTSDRRALETHLPPQNLQQESRVS